MRVLRVLAIVSAQVLGKSERFSTLAAAEGLLARVQVLMLVQEAGVLETLAADVAVVGALLRVSPPVILHDGAMPEDHSTLGTRVGLKSSVGSLMNPQSQGRLKALVALQTTERTFQGVCLHVSSDGHSVLKLLAA